MKRLLASFVLALSIFTLPAHGEDFPSRPIKILVPAAPGGIGDILPRIMGQKLAESGHTIVVENRTGGAGGVAADAVAKAPADGYTLMVVDLGTFTSGAAVNPALPFDPIKDFAPIALVATQPNILVVHPSLPAKSVRELVALAKAKPGDLNYASRASFAAP